MKLDRSILTILTALALMTALVAINPFGRNLATRSMSKHEQVLFEPVADTSR